MYTHTRYNKKTTLIQKGASTYTIMNIPNLSERLHWWFEPTVLRIV